MWQSNRYSNFFWLDDLLVDTSDDGVFNRITLAKNVAVLDFLHAIGSTKYNLMHKLTNQVRQPYQNQMRYRQAEGSLSLLEEWNSTVDANSVTVYKR